MLIMDLDVVTYGDLVVDVLLPIPKLPLCPNEHQLAHAMFIEPGGMGNFLIMANRLGLKVAPTGILGDDFYGQQVRAKLESEGINTSTIHLSTDQASTLALVFISDAGEHVFLGVLSHARITKVTHQASLAIIPKARALYTNGYAFLEADPSQLVIEAMQAARQSGVAVYFDPGPQVFQVDPSLMSSAIAFADTLMLTHEEAVALIGDLDPDGAARELLRRGPQRVVIKLGAGGCLLATTQGVVHLEAFPVDVRDTAGAGDAFDAACLYGSLHALPLVQIGELANAVGGATVSKIGAGTRLPSRQEVMDLLMKKSGSATLSLD